MADIIESMEVSVVPFSVQNSDISRIYKLKMKLYRPEHFPKHVRISLEDWEETLEVMFVRELEDAIENHKKLLEKISGIKYDQEPPHSRALSEADEDISAGRSQREENDDDKGDSDNEGAEDLGLDAQKRRLQGTDDMDYDDDDSEGESIGGEPTGDELSSGSESELDQGDNETEINKDDTFDNGASQGSVLRKQSKLKSKKKGTENKVTGKKYSNAKSKKKRRKITHKDTDRAIFVEAKKMHFEVHFRFTNEPHILLAEVCLRSLF